MRKEKTVQPAKWQQRVESLLYSDHIALTAVKFLLLAAAGGGIVIAGAAVPGLLRLAQGLPRWSSGTNRKAPFSRKRLNDSLVYLKKKKLVEIKERNGQTVIRLTSGGKERVVKYSIDAISLIPPKQWDGKWRVIMFDIPVTIKNHHYARDAFRRKIKTLGFYQIQKSAWVHPYDCESELLFIAETFGVQPYVEILTVGKFLHEDLLRKRFTSLLVS